MTRIIMIASGKGGTGKSTVASLCAQALAGEGKKVLAVELDAGLRSLDIISGISRDTVYDIGDVLALRCEARKAMVASPVYPELKIISAPYSSRDVDFSGFSAFCDSIYGDFDYIIIDTAAGIGNAFYAACEAARMGIIVRTPDPISVRDARLVSDEMFRRGVKDIRLVINKYSPEMFRYSGFEDMDRIIDEVCAQLLGVVPLSNEIAMGSLNGKGLSYTGREANIFRAIAKRLEGRDIQIMIQ